MPEPLVLSPMNPLPIAAVLVTGGAGFIGSHVVESLLHRGVRVRVLDNFTTGNLDNLADRLESVELIQGDIRDPVACKKAVTGLDAVIHLAAICSVQCSINDPGATIATNVLGTANIFQAARDAGIRRVVFASSASVYGSNFTIPNREGSEGPPLSPYALSKSMGEQLAETYRRLFGIDLVSLRYFNVYGPRQDLNGSYSAVVPAYFDRLQRGFDLEVQGTGEQSRDFVYVADVAAASVAAVTAPEAVGGTYNVGSGRSTTIRQLAEEILTLGRSSAKLEYVAGRPNDLPDSRADTAKFRETFGFQPGTSLHDGLMATAEYYLRI